MANNKKQSLDTELTDEDKINVLRAGSLFFLGVLLLFFFFGWCYIRNTKEGVEVGMNGWNFICLSFTWKFSSANKAMFGDVAVPFYYYAQAFIVILTIMAMIIFYVTIALVVLAIFNLAKRSVKITTTMIVLSIVNSVTLLASFVTALAMNASDILPIFCSGNPACSIRSLIILPFLVSALVLVLNIFLRKKLLEKE